ncbi:MAG: phosphomannomutase/phosphoglucomutase [Gammaproteobacteria bacterium]
MINSEIFRAYDIRGIVDQTLTEENVFLIGKVVGEKTLLNGTQQVVVARDGRLSSPRLIAKLTQGIIATGCNVLDLGLVPTPILYFAASTLNIVSAVMLTGSHNPSNYNGLKIILAGNAIYGEQILELRNLIIANKLRTADSNNIGQVIEDNIINKYINYIVSNINVDQNKIKKLKIVIDCGNGAASVVAEKLFSALGIDCIPLYCEIDGNFPNHHPDPGDPKNLKVLQRTVLDNAADLGIAFDGDGDRLGVIDNKGNIIWPDRYLMLFAKDILLKNKNAVIIYDVKSTNHLREVIKGSGGQPLMWKTGHSLIKAKMQETNALLAGEMSGHVFFKDRWFGFDDGLYTAARLIELLACSGKTLHILCNNLPENFSTPELIIKSSEAVKHTIVEKLIAMVHEKAAQITTVDGLRLDFADCWGLVRSSNTTPNLIARFEAVDLVSLDKIKKIFKSYLLAIDASLSIPF